MSNTKMFQINAVFAKAKNVPVYFVGKVLIETAKAVYIYGRGTTETRKTGRCCVCGKALTHPVSILLGIGPVCGSHWYDWDAVGGYTEENLAKLKTLVEDIKVDNWFPKTCVISMQETEEEVTVPSDHPKLSKPEEKKIGKTAKAARFNNNAPAIKLEFPFDYKTIEQVKTLSGRKYHSDGKYWTCPMTLDNLEKIKELGFSVDSTLSAFLEKSNLNIDEMEAVEVKGLGGSLLPFQEKGVAFIEARGGRALLADEMGLGKTVQALAWLQLHPELRPAVVVCPATLKWNWANEAKAWMKNPKINILSGGTGSSISADKEDIIIINYDILPNKYKGKGKERKEVENTGWVDYLIAIKPKVVILDEAHFVKNNSAQRTDAVKKLCKKANSVLALSGTPATSRPIELYNALKLVDKTVVPDFWKYVHRYCGAKHNGFGWDFTGATNTDELHKRLISTIMIRRLKKDVLKDLPEKLFSHTPLELDSAAAKEYQRASGDFLEWVKETKGAEASERAGNAEALAKIEALKQLAVKGKLKQAIEWIADMIESNGKLVVFAMHANVINSLMERFGNIAVKVDGSVTGPERQKAVERFQTDENVRLFVGNIKAAGVGITLTASSKVAFLEFPWTPGELSQAEDRCHRIGQDRGVNIYYLVARDTVEETIARMLDKKKINLDAILDGIETEEESLLWTLIKSVSEEAA